MTPRIKRLKQVEEHCYRICYHLLESEELALEAAKTALTRLYQNDLFFVQPDKEAYLVRSEAVRASLELHADNVRPLPLGV